MFRNRLLAHQLITRRLDPLHAEVDLRDTRQHPQTVRHVPLLVLPLLPLLKLVPLRDLVQLCLRIVRFRFAVSGGLTSPFLQFRFYVRQPVISPIPLETSLHVFVNVEGVGLLGEIV